MGTINTRLSIRSSNLFKGSFSQRHDRTFNVETRVEQGTRLIKENSSGSPYELASGAEYYDSTESGAIANQVYIFIRNVASVAAKTITVQFNKAGVRDDVILLNNGEYTMFPWLCNAATDKLEIYSNDTAGVKVEYIITPML